jgi:hypothetical protein
MLHEKYNQKTNFLVSICLSVSIVAGSSSAIRIGYFRTEQDGNEIYNEKEIPLIEHRFSPWYVV